jgi:hypothetical protein
MAWFALGAYLLVGLLPFQALVLCVDGEGRVSLEAATEEGTCFDCSPPAGVVADRCCTVPQEENGTSASEPCDCSDVVLITSSSQPQRLSQGLAVGWHTPAISCHGFEISPPQRLVEPSRDRSQTHGPPGPLRAQRTVVLLI